MSGPFPNTLAGLSGPQSLALIDQNFNVSIARVASFAALRLLTTVDPSVVYLPGGVSFNDGKQGTFGFDGSDTTSADDGNNIIVDASGHRWRRLSNLSITAANITDASADGRALLTAAGVGAQRTLLGVYSATQTDGAISAAINSLAPVASSGSAADLSSGTLPAARLPNPGASTLGGVKSLAAAANRFLISISTTGQPVAAQPTLADLSNTGLLTLAAPATINVTSATTAIDLAASGSNLILLTGNTGAYTSAGIGSLLATARAGQKFKVVNTGDGPIELDGNSHLQLICNWNAAQPYLLLLPGDSIEVWALAPTVAAVIDYNAGGLFGFVDARPNAGEGPVDFKIGLDQLTSFPDFAVLQSDLFTHLLCKSQQWAEIGNAPNISYMTGTGTVSSPAPNTGVTYCGAIRYAWADYLAWSCGSSPPNLSYNNPRFSQNYDYQVETPTGSGSYLRGGGQAWGVTRKNKALGDMLTPDVMYLHPGDASGTGGASIVALGRVSWEESPYYRTGHAYAGVVPAAFNFSSAWDFSNNLAYGNVVIACSDMNTVGFAAIAMRKPADNAAGWDIGYDSSHGLVIFTVSGGTRTSRWSIDDSGTFFPIANNSLDFGASSKRVSTVYGIVGDFDRASVAPSMKLRNTASGFNDDVLQIKIDGASPSGKFLACTVGGVAKINLRESGDGTCSGAWIGGGADRGECREWADGNPKREDRTGWAVVFDEKVTGKIRRATPDDPPARVLGIVSIQSDSIGNAAPMGWQGQFQRDAMGRVLTQRVTWVEWTEDVYEIRTVTRQTLQPQALSAHEEVVDTRRGIHAVLNGEADQEILRTVIDDTQEEVLVEQKRHVYRADQVPPDLDVPKDAATFDADEPIQSPDYDPGRPYLTRIERARLNMEWAIVGYMGAIPILAGEQTGDRWIKMGDLAPGVELWDVR